MELRLVMARLEEALAGWLPGFWEVELNLRDNRATGRYVQLILRLVFVFQC